MEDEKDIELHGQEQEIGGEENTDNTDENKDDPKYRGKVLMKRALEQLEQGNIEEFETDRALANEYFDKMGEEEEEMDALYNESRNFGIIYNVIEANVPKLLESEEGKKALRSIVKTIKSDKMLHEQFKAYNNLQPSTKIENVDEYITEALSIVPNFDKKTIKESNEKLIKLIKKHKLDEMVDIDDEKLDLYESIEFVTMNKKNLKNIDEYVNATKMIKESIEKLPINETNDFSIENYAEEVNNVSENIAKDLNSAEIKLLKEVTSGNGETYFNECKAKTLSKLNEMIYKETDIESKSRLSKIYEKINNKIYNKKNALVDIAEMVEMQDAIDE